MIPLTDLELKLFREDIVYAFQGGQDTLSRKQRAEKVLDELLFLRRELTKRNDQVGHLQARGTDLINETRLLRAKLNAAKNVLTYFLIEKPIDELGGATAPTSLTLMSLYKRLEMLENTAASKIAHVAAEYVHELRQMFVEDDVTGIHPDFAKKYGDRFAAILDA